MTAGFSSTAFTPGDIIAGNSHLLTTRPITLASGENLARGTVLGKVTADGKYLLSLSAAVDGSEVPDLILAEDCDASAGDKAAVAYERGDFIEQALAYGTGHDADSVRETLRDKGIVLIKQGD